MSLPTTTIAIALIVATVIGVAWVRARAEPSKPMAVAADQGPANQGPGDQGPGAPDPSEADAIPRSWLDKVTSVAQAEADAMIDGVPFGAQNQKWRALVATIEPGDEIWTFASSSESWRALAGRAGIALVRKGRPVAALVTVMN